MDRSSSSTNQHMFAPQQHILVQHGSIVQQGSIVHQSTSHHDPLLVHHELHHVAPQYNSTSHHQNEKMQTYKQQQIVSNQYRKHRHQPQQQQQQLQQQHFQSDLQQHQEGEIQQTSDEPQLQQYSSENDHTENVNSEVQDPSEPASLNLHCLVCNKRLWVLNNGANNGVYDLFAEKTRTSHRRLRPVEILEGIVKEELIYAPLHSNIICKKCFHLIDEIDQIEVRLIDKREELSSLYFKTKAKVNKEPLKNPKEEKDTDTGGPVISGRSKEKLGQVMLDMRSGKLVMHREEINEKEPPKKVSLVNNNNDDGDDDINVDDGSYEIHVGHAPDNEAEYESTYIEEFHREEFICRLCDMSFKSVGLLNKHMDSHDASTYLCHYCELSFHKATDLQIHLDQHLQQQNSGKVKIMINKSSEKGQDKSSNKNTKTGEKNFICPICGKVFKGRKDLQDHRRTHTGEKPFQCDICGNSFSQKGNLLMHKRITHMKEKRFKCDICDKAFKWKRILVGHVMSVHTGERPYKCEHCEAAFVYPQHYKKHMRIHTGEKPFVCDICGKSFNCSNNCNAHMFTHTDRKQFECLLCSAGFMRKTQAITHIKQQHGHSQDLDQYFKVNTPADVLPGIGSPGATRTAVINDHSNAATVAVIRPTGGRSLKIPSSGGRKYQIKDHTRNTTQMLTTVSEVDHRALHTSASALPHTAITASVVMPSSAHATNVSAINLPPEQNTSHTQRNIEIYDMPVIFIDSNTAGSGDQVLTTQHYTTLQHSKDQW